MCGKGTNKKKDGSVKPHGGKLVMGAELSYGRMCGYKVVV